MAATTTTQVLEDEIAAMETRLASVRVAVDGEREAWQKSYRTGKSGTKWRGAAGAARSGPPLAVGGNAPAALAASSRDPASADALDASESIMPSYWDALELAQYLQTKQLTAFAQVVIYEQITGKALLATPPGKLRALFQDVIASASDPNWKAFVHVTSGLYKLQKRLERAAAASSSGAASAAATADADESERRLRTALPLRKPPVNGQQLATCWNCGARFPRAQACVRSSTSSTLASRTPPTRLFCSPACQRAIESADMSVSSSLSASVSLHVSTAREPLGSQRTNNSNSGDASDAPSRSVRAGLKTKHKSKSEGSGLVVRTHPSTSGAATATPGQGDGLVDLLHVAHRSSGTVPPVFGDVPRPPPQSTLPSSSASKPSGSGTVVRKRLLIGATSAHSPSVASIAPTRDSLVAASLVLTNASEAATTRQSRVFQQSIYKLDPELYQANGVSFATCFFDSATTTAGAAAADTSAMRRKNLVRLQEYLSVQSLHHLSLTSRSWFDALVHQSAVADALWGVHLLRIWRRTDADDDVFLHDIGVLGAKPERPRQMLRKLTRHVGRVVLENMKALLQPESWQLASPMTTLPHVTLQTALRSVRAHARSHSSSGMPVALPPSPNKSQLASPDLFEQIAIVCNRKGEVVAVRAQELIRPVDTDAMLTDILHGVRTGALCTIECRRLRLFSSANRLAFDQWHELAHCRTVFDFFWSTDADAQSALARVWHQKVLERMQRAMQQRLLAKESVQQVLKAMHERNGPPQALIALEQFLTACHASGMAAQTAAKRKKELQHQHQQQHSPSSRTALL